MITQRAMLLGFVGVCFYVIAIVNTLPTYYFGLAWLAVGLLVSSFGMALLSLIGLQCTWSVTRSRSSEATDEASEAGPLLRVQLSNGGSFNKTNITVEALLQPRGESQLVQKRFLVEALPAGAAIEAELPLRDLGRGRYDLIELRLLGSDVLGLFLTRKRLPAKGGSGAELVIGPAVLSASGNSSARRGLPGNLPGEVDSHVRLGQGDELRGTRPYVPGDDLRQVHWKTTARAGQLVVKEFHHRGRSSTLVVWDGAAAPAGSEATEWGLRLTASLCTVLVEGGVPCVLARLDEQPLATESGSGAGGLLGMLTDILADARASRATPLLAAAAALPQQADEIYFITASLSPEVPRLVAQWESRGANIRVGLINAFELDSSMSRRGLSGWRRRQRVQNVETRGASGETVRVQLPITAEAYEAQVKAIRGAGGRPLLIGPENSGGVFSGGGFAGGGFALPLRRALHLLLSAEEIGSRERNTDAEPAPGATAAVA